MVALGNVDIISDLGLKLIPTFISQCLTLRSGGGKHDPF
jgi:hypothetical protein